MARTFPAMTFYRRLNKSATLLNLKREINPDDILGQARTDDIFNLNSLVLGDETLPRNP